MSPIPHCLTRDWPEDHEHENGNYYNTCRECGEVFIGHKRRLCCRVCATPKSVLETLRKLEADNLALGGDAQMHNDNEQPRTGIAPVHLTAPANSTSDAAGAKDTGFVKLLSEATAIVENYALFKRFIDGTPLRNDIPVWMAQFAMSHQPEGGK